jgi:alpha-acetolactate decarboxylase
MRKSAGRLIADVQASGYHLRLISEIVPAGCTAMVYDLKAKKVLFQELAENLEDSKAKGEEFAKTLVSGRPTIVWRHITA